MRPDNSLHSVLNSSMGKLLGPAHNCNFDLFMARQWNLFDVIIDRIPGIISKGDIGVIIGLSQSREVFSQHSCGSLSKFLFSSLQ